MSKKIPAAIRTAVWNRFIGVDMGSALCYIGCGEQISKSNFECGHIIARSKGGSAKLVNLRPICSHCNKSMGTTCMLDFVLQYGLNVQVRDKQIIPKEKKQKRKRNVFVNVLKKLNNDDIKIIIYTVFNSKIEYDSITTEYIETNFNENIFKIFLQNCTTEIPYGSSLTYEVTFEEILNKINKNDLYYYAKLYKFDNITIRSTKSDLVDALSQSWRYC